MLAFTVKKLYLMKSAKVRSLETTHLNGHFMRDKKKRTEKDIFQLNIAPIRSDAHAKLFPNSTQ